MVTPRSQISWPIVDTGSSGSRLTTGNLNLYTKLERKIASLKQTEAAIVFSSGYLANTGVIPALAVEEDLILSDELNHASIIDGCRLSKARKSIYLQNQLTPYYFRIDQIFIL